MQNEFEIEAGLIEIIREGKRGLGTYARNFFNF